MNVIVVEDNQRLADLYVDVLRHVLRHDARAFADGESFLEALPALAPDLVVLDFDLPGRDGLDIARQVRTRYPDLPLLMISGDPPARNTLVDAILTKPCTIRQLSEAVTTLLARRGIQNDRFEAERYPSSSFVFNSSQTVTRF